MSKSAVLFYGMIRNFSSCAHSLKKHLISPNHADVYFFGPSYTDKPSNSHYGEFDEKGFLIKNPKSMNSKMYPADMAGFLKQYQGSIQHYATHDLKYSFFEREAKKITGSYDWLFNLNPARILSMFYNISGVIDIFIDFTKRNSIVYDSCVITRPDLALYAPIYSQPEKNSVHIPQAQGFSKIGEAYTINAPVYFYKNAQTGEYVPGGRKETFNDQLLVLSMTDLLNFKGLYDEIKEMIKRKVPLSPETLFYLFVKNNNLKIIQEEGWFYEIFREDTPIISNVISSPELQEIDPYHPSLKEKYTSKKNIRFL